MLKRFQQLSFLLLGLFVAYLLIIRIFISWAQLAPEQFFSVVENVSDSVINVETLSIDQSWLGLSYQVQGLEFDNDSASIRLDYAKGDINIFSPLFPDISIGRLVEIDGLSIRMLRSSNASSSNTFQLRDLSLNDYWKVIKLNNISFEIPFENKPLLRGGVESFQSYRGMKWSYGGIVWLGLQDGLRSRVQLKGDYSLSLWGAPVNGEGKISVLSPVSLQDLYRLMPHSWGLKMPEGELLADIGFELKDGKLARARLTSNAQQLYWPENDDILPKSIGVGLKWVSLGTDRSRSVFENWAFELEQFRFDNEYIKTISPIRIQLQDNQILSFSAERIDFKVLKPFFEIMLAKLEYQGVGDNLEQFDLHNVKGELNLQALRFDQLHLEIPKFNLPERGKVPGLVLSDLKIDKSQRTINLQSSQPLAFQISVVHPDPILMRIPQGIDFTLDRLKEQWDVPSANFTLDGMPVNLSLKGDFSGYLDGDLHINPEDMAFVKDYLPYQLMSKNLEHWLKTALVDGDGIKGTLKVKGNMANFPFKDGSGVFDAKVEVHNTILKFQPDWPAIDRFSAKLFFSPYNLKITSTKAMLDKVVGKDIVVDINHLDSKNIAVQVKGKAEADALDATQYLKKTPLPALIGLDTFLNDIASINGPIGVRLPKIWIPVYGYDNREEAVQGEISFKENDLVLFDRLAFSKMKGTLFFTESAVRSKSIQGLFENGEANVSVKTEKGIVNILAEGDANLKSAFYYGKMPWKTHVQIPLKSREGQDSLLVETQANIINVTSLLPSPFNESDFQALSERPAWFKGNVRLNRNDIFVDANVDTVLKTKFQLTTEDLLPSKMSLAFGRSTISQDLQLVDGLNARGHIPVLDLDAWIDVWPKLSEQLKLEAPDKGKASSRIWYNSELSFNQVILGDFPFSNVRASWSTISVEKESELAINVASNELEAVATRMRSGDVGIKVSKLDIHLPEEKKENTSSQKVKQLPAKCQNPKKQIDLPNIVFEGSNLRVNERYLSKLNFKLSDSSKMLTVKDMKIRFGRVNGEASGQYEFNKVENRSHIAASIDARNVEDITVLLGIKKGFKGKRGKVTTDLRWQGDVDCFSVIGLNGRLGFEFKDGVIDQAEPGIARLIGLLSFEALARRLQLNLDDVTSEGLVYDRIEGSGRFRRGIFGFEKLQLDAPAATAKVFGEVNLIQEQFDLSAEITPAIGSTLPAIAAISGVATPIAGLAAYALLKVVPIVNEDLVTYRYEVSGTFENPVIKDKGLNLDIIQLKGQSSIEDESILDAE